MNNLKKTDRLYAVCQEHSLLFFLKKTKMSYLPYFFERWNTQNFILKPNNALKCFFIRVQFFLLIFWKSVSHQPFKHFVILFPLVEKGTTIETLSLLYKAQCLVFALQNVLIIYFDYVWCKCHNSLFCYYILKINC